MGTPYVPAPGVKQRAITTVRAELVERLGEVAVKRAALAAVDAEVETQERAFFATIEPLTNQQADLKAQLTVAEQEARALALDLYAADPTNKQPAPGIGIRVKRGVEYELDRAFEWAKAKGLFVTPPMLDEKALSKFLLTEPQVDGLSYAITETPTAAIASELPLPEPAP